MACSEIVHNGGWYNLAGEKLGWGDLAAADIIRLMAELQVDEAFLVIGEQASHWAFTQYDMVRFGTAGMDHAAPGLAYVLEHLRWVILSGDCLPRKRVPQRRSGSRPERLAGTSQLHLGYSGLDDWRTASAWFASAGSEGLVHKPQF
jgi:hypothetical protein